MAVTEDKVDEFSLRLAADPKTEQAPEKTPGPPTSAWSGDTSPKDGDTSPPSPKDGDTSPSEGRKNTPELQRDASNDSVGTHQSGLGAITKTLWVRYVWLRTKEHMISVGMISGYLLIFYLSFLQKAPSGSVFLGLFFVMLGITFFMEGFMSGILPLAETLGRGIPNKFSFHGAMLTTFLLGIACTLAEPAMGALEVAGSKVSVTKAPILWYLLSAWNFYVFLSVGLGVGLAALVGTVRLLRGWNLKIIIYSSTVGTIGSTILAEAIGLSEIVGLAWDAGAVTTGAVTVPIILGLGVGIMMTDRKNKGITDEGNPLDSFGIVTLASLFPIICVLCLGFLCDATVDKADILKYAIELAQTKADTEETILDKSPIVETIYATRAVVPLIALVVGLIKIVMREPLPHVMLNIRDVKFSEVGAEQDENGVDMTIAPPEGHIRIHCFVGVAQAYIGLVIFNVGLRHGQGPLGDQVGAAVPGFYSKLDSVDASPAFSDRGVGMAFVCIFTFFMAFTATYAEPALNAMGMTTEQLTKGAFKKWLLLFAVALGVSFGVMFGVLRMLLGWSLTWMLVASYPVACLLTVVSDIEYVAVAWDCAGVTTSSITVPLVLAMGLGLGSELGVQDSFGLLAMGSIGPIICVLVAGRLAKFKNEYIDKPKAAKAEAAGAASPA